MSETPDPRTGPFDLAATPIHLDTEGTGAAPIPGFGFDPASFEAYIEAHCRPDAPGRLVFVETTAKSWKSWERHTEGDEIVIVLEGRADFLQEIDGAVRRTPVGPGSAIINPKGVWHSADVEAPLKAIYVTPCPGTEHRPR